MLVRLLRRLLSFVSTAVLLVLVGVGVTAWLTMPGRGRDLRLAGLGSAVQVAFDADGIPRIAARSALDAATALGAVHARDRMFQMDLTRRVASGRLSEIAGSRTVRLDRMMLTLGLRRRAEAELPSLPAELRALLDAYARGVNAVIADRGRFVSPEFVVLGRPAPWTAVDSLMWGKSMALWLSSNYRTELARANLAGRLSPGWLKEMWPPQENVARPQAALSRPDRSTSQRLASLTYRLLSALPAFPAPFTQPGTASNEWAVDGRFAENGKPLLAGDPHLAFGMPGLWYLARIDTPDGVLAGATAPGVPFVVLGRNSRIAWTFTTTGADTEDVFTETVLPDGRYATPDGPRPFDTRQERIVVRGAGDITFTVRETRHGPVISDVDGVPDPPAGGTAGGNGTTVLAVAMAALAPNDTAAAGLFALNSAGTVDEAGRAAVLITSPVQNLLVADQARIALFTTGRVPVRRAGNGQAPVPGADGRFDWTGLASGEALPQIVAPASGRLVNANERTAPPDFPVFMGADTFGDWRARRIRRLLSATPRHSVRGFAAMQVDAVSEFAAALLPLLRQVQTDDPQATRALALLAHWDGRMDADLPQPLIFNAWLRRFEADVLDKAGVPPLGPWTDFTAFVLSPAGEHWCGGDCRPLLARSLADAVASLSRRFGPVPADWRWGDAHQAVFAYPLLGAVGAVRIPQPGDDTTIFRGTSARGSWDSVHGPGFRGAYDLSDLDSSLFSVAPGQSGNLLSPLARNMVGRWRDGAGVRLAPLQAAPSALLRMEP